MKTITPIKQGRQYVMGMGMVPCYNVTVTGCDSRAASARIAADYPSRSEEEWANRIVRREERGKFTVFTFAAA